MTRLLISKDLVSVCFLALGGGGSGALDKEGRVEARDEEGRGCSFGEEEGGGGGIAGGSARGGYNGAF